MKTLCNFELQIWSEIITSRDAESTCFKGSRTSCDVIIWGFFGPNFGRKRSHHLMDASCRCSLYRDFLQKVFPCSATLAEESYAFWYSWAPNPRARAYSPKPPFTRSLPTDNKSSQQIYTFKSILSWHFPRKHRFWTIFLSASNAPLKTLFLFYCSLAVSDLQNRRPCPFCFLLTSEKRHLESTVWHCSDCVCAWPCKLGLGLHSHSARCAPATRQQAFPSTAAPAMPRPNLRCHLLCLLSRIILWISYTLLSAHLAMKNGGIVGEFSVVSSPRKRSTKSPQGIRGNFKTVRCKIPFRMRILEARKGIPKNLSSQVFGEVRVNLLGWIPTKTLYSLNRRSELFRKFLGRLGMILWNLCYWKICRPPKFEKKNGELRFCNFSELTLGRTTLHIKMVSILVVYCTASRRMKEIQFDVNAAMDCIMSQLWTCKARTVASNKFLAILLM